MRSLMNEVRHAVHLCGVLAAAALVASCGGGEQVSDFNADRVIALGDETSLIVDLAGNGNGQKYSVNGTVSDTDLTLDCKTYPIWIQAVAAKYGLVFPQCNYGASAVPAPRSRIRASLGAVVADLTAQIDAQNAESPIGDGDLVTVLVGQNDVIAQYLRYPASSEADITTGVQAAGTELGRQVNRLADMGAKVLILTVPSVGYAPFGLTEKAAHADIDRADLLNRLTGDFNSSLRAQLNNDGRRIGLVLFDELVSAVAKFPGLNNLSETTDGACDLSKSMLTPPSILDCSVSTLMTGASATTYLWADDRHLTAGSQSSLGSLAVSRADNNPF